MRYPCRLSPWVKKIVHTKHCGIAHVPWKPASISLVQGNVFTEIPSGWSTFQPISIEACSPPAHLCSHTTALIVDNDSCDRFATGVSLLSNRAITVYARKYPYGGVTCIWASWRLKSQTTRLYVKQLRSTYLYSKFSTSGTPLINMG